MAERLYRALWMLALPFAIARLVWRSRREPGYRLHMHERFGRYRGVVLRAPTIWMHAVSVGETRALQPLLRALVQAHPEASILLTHMTPGGRHAARQSYADLIDSGRLASVYLPYDLPFAMRRFLARFRPAFGLLMETEIWPTLLEQCEAARVPVMLVNARLSARSAERGARLRFLFEPAARRIALALAQTPADARRLQAFGASNVEVCGNLKFDMAIDPALIELGRAWRKQAGARPVIVCASTREANGQSEEAMLLDALRGRTPPRDALLVLVPRHPQRFDAVFGQAKRAGYVVSRRSAQGPDAGTQVWIGDSMGELPAYYAMADLAFVGGSLLPLGGQNLIEACACGCPVLIGPHTFNFEQAARDAIEAGAARRVDDAASLWLGCDALLHDEHTLTAARSATNRFASEHRGATERTIAALTPWLDTLVSPSTTRATQRDEAKPAVVSE